MPGVPPPVDGPKLALPGGSASSPETRTTVVVVDDHRVFAELLAESLAQAGLEVLGTVSTAAEAVRLVGAVRPAVVVLDQNLPDADGTATVHDLKRAAPGVRVLMLTSAVERTVLREALDSGCDGFITKRQGTSEVLAAIRAVCADELPVSPDMVGALVGRRRAGVPVELTQRETEVLRLLAQGLPSRQVAEALNLSVNTVRNHTQHLLTKLDAHSRLEAVAIATRLGILRAR